MATYNTMQKQSILQILSSYTDRAFTVKEIAEMIRADRSITCHPSESSIYRIMNEFVKNGTVHKTVNSKREYQYTFIARNDLQITVRCKICGKIEHIDEKVCHDIIDELKNNSYIQTDDDIEVTGICDKCK